MISRRRHPLRHLTRLLPVGLLVMGLLCNQQSVAESPAAAPVALPVAEPGPPWPLVPATPLPADIWYRTNCSARGLAGLKSPSGYGAEQWENTAEWQDYAKALGENWNYLERVRLQAMAAWGNTELAALRIKSPAVFYPFSGPDVLYADTFFPTSKFLLMAGLEPVGTMPDLATVTQQQKLAAYLGQLKTSLFTILAASFFKTKDMKTDFNNQLMDGLMPAIATFLARQGYTIDSIQYVSLGRDGMLRSRAEKAGEPGVQVTYFGPQGRNDLRVLLYFQADLGDDGLKANPGFIRLMHRLGPGLTYLKAASYLLHEGYFSTIRDSILADSLGVVEDDSGLPFRAFDPAKWEVFPYGNYTGPIKLFEKSDQPDLHAFFAKTPHQPLPFGSGYKFNAEESSLLVAKKKL